MDVSCSTKSRCRCSFWSITSMCFHPMFPPAWGPQWGVLAPLQLWPTGWPWVRQNQHSLNPLDTDTGARTAWCAQGGSADASVDPSSQILTTAVRDLDSAPYRLTPTKKHFHKIHSLNIDELFSSELNTPDLVTEKIKWECDDGPCLKYFWWLGIYTDEALNEVLQLRRGLGRVILKTFGQQLVEL